MRSLTVDKVVWALLPSKEFHQPVFSISGIKPEGEHNNNDCCHHTKAHAEELINTSHIKYRHNDKCR